LEQEVFSSEIFDLAFGQNHVLKQNLFSRVKPIAGDLLLDNLGLSPSDRALLISEIEVIINCAASVNFDDHLHDAIRINYQGTLKMLDLGHQC
jgi:fatty acyl-CoA reductase